MSIIKSNESFPERPIIITLYGTPGVGKTSLSCTAENPILIDCDRGADRACTRVDTIMASKWTDVLAEEKEFQTYKTVIFDTAKAILDDYMMGYVVEKDYKLKTNKLKAYGAIGDEFKLFTNTRRSENLDLIILAHAKEDKKGDITTYSPDVTGQSKDLILRISDQVGFVSMVNNKRTITFEPTDITIGKNVARIPTMEIPDESDLKYKTFMSEIIQNVKNAIRNQSEAQVDAQKAMDELRLMIEACLDNFSLMEVSSVCASLPKHQQAAARKLLSEKVEQLGMKYDKVSNSFISKT